MFFSQKLFTEKIFKYSQIFNFIVNPFIIFFVMESFCGN